jgi:hypothetical protein
LIYQHWYPVNELTCCRNAEAASFIPRQDISFVIFSWTIVLLYSIPLGTVYVLILLYQRKFQRQLFLGHLQLYFSVLQVSWLLDSYDSSAVQSRWNIRKEARLCFRLRQSSQNCIHLDWYIGKGKRTDIQHMCPSEFLLTPMRRMTRNLRSI